MKPIHQPIRPAGALFLILATIFLLTAGGCTQEEIAAPPREPAAASTAALDQASLKSEAGAAAFADLAVTAFSAPAAVGAGDVLPLTATIANLGSLNVTTPFTVRIYEPYSGTILARVPVPLLPAGVSLSGTINFHVPAKALAAVQAVTPGVYTLICRHDFADPFPANDFLTIQVELLPGDFLGQVVIDPEPDFLAAPWSMTGPDSTVTSGAGDATLAEMTPGDYTVAWGQVPGWVAPAGYTLTLLQGGAIVFAGLYTTIPTGGTIVIDPEPDALNAPWQLQGPTGLRTGSGDLTLIDQPIGLYTITWLSVPNYVTPPPESLTLGDGHTITFTATYQTGGFGEVIGFWFDQSATLSCVEASFLAHVPAYIVYVDPSVNLVRGFECGLDMSGATTNSLLSVTFPVPAIDVGLVTPPHYNYIVGFSVPLPTAQTTVLATIDIFLLDAAALAFDLGPSNPASIPGQPVLLRDDYSLLGVEVGSPTAYLHQPGGCPPKSVQTDTFGEVRRLLR